MTVRARRYGSSASSERVIDALKRTRSSAVRSLRRACSWLRNAAFIASGEVTLNPRRFNRKLHPRQGETVIEPPRARSRSIAMAATRYDVISPVTEHVAATVGVRQPATRAALPWPHLLYWR